MRRFAKHTYEGNAVYEGYVDAQGQRDGQGLYIDKKQNRYQGEWFKDKSHGYGVKKFATGDVHEGYYVKDKRHGWGVSLHLSCLSRCAWHCVGTRRLSSFVAFLCGPPLWPSCGRLVVLWSRSPFSLVLTRPFFVSFPPFHPLPDVHVVER
jgi:hypothetical protein